MPIKKIVIIGPESTGKSSLCEGLAAHYHTDWVPEYAREYLLKNGMSYSYADLSTIARGQLALEDAHMAALEDKAAVGAWGAGSVPSGIDKGPSFLFVDTDMYVLKVWSEFVFGRCESWILEEIVSRKYDAYLLCRTDIPWVKDELREYPDLITREKLFAMYKAILIGQATPWAEVGGEGEQRLQNGIRALEALL
jgi:nicotinamide riboside kinase